MHQPSLVGEEPFFI
jgi:hypothetical protein